MIFYDITKKAKISFRKLIILFSYKNKLFRNTIKLNYLWYGNWYGGFNLHPNLIDSNSIVYSFGIGEDVSFDLEVISKHNCSVYAFDPTPKSFIYIKSINLDKNFHFYNYGISNYSGVTNFFLPKNPNYVSGSILNNHNLDDSTSIKVNMKTLKDIVKELGHNKIDVLKMDIEGSEYNVLDDILKSNIIISQIVLEFHDNVIDGKNKTINITKKLIKHGFEIFAKSNNLDVISFINKRHLSSIQIH